MGQVSPLKTPPEHRFHRMRQQHNPTNKRAFQFEERRLNNKNVANWVFEKQIPF